MADKKQHIFLVDDDATWLDYGREVLESAGYRVSTSDNAKTAFDDILKLEPDVVLADIMMPNVDGLALCRRVRDHKKLSDIKFIMISSKTYEADRQKSIQAGADGHLFKHMEEAELLSTLDHIIQDSIILQFWGIRGTLPVPGERAVRYGGNTNCISLHFSKGQFIILDGGTGIKELARHLIQTGHDRELTATILITHPHWDHIHGLPFFTPFFIQSNEFTIYGPRSGESDIKDIMALQMDGTFFPILIKEFSADVQYRTITEESFLLDEIPIKTIHLNHPGTTLGYKIEYKTRVICYITDNELYPPDVPQYNKAYIDNLIQFIEGCDMLITDSSFSDETYYSKVGWGHSGISQVVDLAHKAKVKELFLIHHNPDDDDDDIDNKLKVAQDQLKKLKSSTKVIAPKEKDIFKI